MISIETPRRNRVWPSVGVFCGTASAEQTAYGSLIFASSTSITGISSRMG